jgi:hypothetical protein
MKKELPVIVLVIAILHFVGGGVGLIFDCVGVAGQLAGGGTASMKKLGIPTGAAAGQSDVDVEEVMRQKVPGFMAFTIGHLSVDTLLCVMMIVAGIGLLKLQSWGRYLSLGYALLSILTRLAQVTYSYMFVVPVSIEAIQMMYEGMPEPGRTAALNMMPMMRVIMWFSPLFNLLWIIYPIVVLVLLTRPRVVQAFSGQSDEMEPSAPS